jgi:hypothetical protein
MYERRRPHLRQVWSGSLRGIAEDIVSSSAVRVGLSDSASTEGELNTTTRCHSGNGRNKDFFLFKSESPGLKAKAGSQWQRTLLAELTSLLQGVSGQPS